MRRFNHRSSAGHRGVWRGRRSNGWRYRIRRHAGLSTGHLGWAWQLRRRRRRCRSRTRMGSRSHSGLRLSLGSRTRRRLMLRSASSRLRRWPGLRLRWRSWPRNTFGSRTTRSSLGHLSRHVGNFLSTGPAGMRRAVMGGVSRLLGGRIIHQDKLDISRFRSGAKQRNLPTQELQDNNGYPESQNHRQVGTHRNQYPKHQATLVSITGIDPHAVGRRRVIRRDGL